MSVLLSQELQMFLASQTPAQIDALAKAIHNIQASQTQNTDARHVQSPMRKKSMKNSSVTYQLPLAVGQTPQIVSPLLLHCSPHDGC